MKGRLKKPEFKPAKPAQASWDNFRGGLNTFFRQTEIKGNELSQADNLMLVGEGVPTKRWGSQDYMLAAATGYGRGLYSSKSVAESIELLAITDWGILSKKNGASYTEITGVSWPSGYNVEMTQLDNRVYLVSQKRELSRYNFTSLTNFPTLSLPGGVQASNFSGATGSTTYSWRITAVSQVGETLGSTAISMASLPQDLSDTMIRIQWTPVSAASGILKQYNIYRGNPGDETWLAAVDNDTTIFFDVGADTSILSTVPATDTTGGPKAKYITRYQDRLVMAGLAGEPTKVLISGRVPYHERFDWSTGGGWILVDPDTGDCYDEETEILTDSGWKRFRNLNRTENVMTLNPETKEAEWQKPTNYIEHDYNGEMISFNSNDLDLLVTPKHKFYIENIKNKANGRFVQARDIKNYSGGIPKRAKWRGTEIESLCGVPIEQFVKFLGIWLVDGSVVGSKGGQVYKSNYGIYITQKEGKKRNKIRKLLKSLPFNFSESELNFRINNKKLWGYLSKLGNSYTKYIPQEIKGLPPKYLELLWKWMLLGDGTIYSSCENVKHETRKYYSISKRLTDDIQEILLKMGKTGVVRIKAEGGKNGSKIGGRQVNGRYPLYVVTERRGEYTYFTHTDKSYIGKKNYQGKIYCVEVPNHIVYVRRNGKPVFSGNSITGLAVHQNKIIVFKEKSVWQVTLGTSQIGNFTVLEPTYQLITASQGCSSHRSIVAVDNDLLFCNTSGIYVLGYEPNILNVLRTNELSAKVRPFFNSITNSDFKNSSAAYLNRKYIIAFPTAKRALVFDRERVAFMGPWTTSFGINQFAKHIDSSGIERWLAIDNDDTYVTEFSNTLTDDKGSAFRTVLKTKKEDFGDWSIFKTINENYTYFRNVFGGVNVNVYLEERSGLTKTAKTFSVTTTQTVSGWGTDQWGLTQWGLSNNDAEASSAEVIRRALLYKTARTFQIEMTTSNKADNYELLGIKTFAMPQGRGGTPPSWRV